MSRIRVMVDGRPEWRDLGPSTGRVSFTRYGVRGGGPPVVPGWRVVGISPKTNARSQAEYRSREAEKARERRAAR